VGYRVFGNPSTWLQTPRVWGDNRFMRETGQGVIAKVGTEAGPTRSSTPNVYAPLRFRIGGIEGIPTGAAIVGTPQGNGMVAIEVEITPDVEPNPEVWSSWVADAAQRHAAGAEAPAGEKQETKLVSEAALVEIGKWVQGQLRIDDTTRGAQLSRWIQAGRADHVVEKPFPHEP
jgi:hypothetical protein